MWYALAFPATQPRIHYRRRTFARGRDRRHHRHLQRCGRRPPLALVEWDEYEGFAQRTRSLTSLVAYRESDIAFGQGAAARIVRAGVVSPNYFQVLGVRAHAGHLPARDDEVLLSFRFWQSEFHGDAAIAGRVLHLGGQPFTIAGVLPREFNGISVESGPPLHLLPGAERILSPKSDPRTCCAWEIAGRLRRGIALDAAGRETQKTMRASMIAAAERRKPLTAEARESILHQRFEVESVQHGVSRLRDRFGSGLLIVFAGALLLLLLACANIAGMMVARAAAREREMSLRAALGATRGRLIRLWMAESSVLAILGGGLGLLLAAAALPAVGGLMPPLRDLAAFLVPVALDLRLDARVFGFAFALCALAAVLSGIAPAWHAARASLIDSIKATGSGRRARLRAVLTVVQVAICTLVLANAALLVTTLRALRTAPAGFDRDRIVTFTIDAPNTGDLATRLEREAAALPGVDKVALASRSLMRGTGMKTGVGLPGTRNGRELNTSTNPVSPAYFETMGMRLVAGRGFLEDDGDDHKPRRVIVNQAFVARFFPNGNPIGRAFGIGFDRVVTPDYEVVGVVTDARYRSLREPFQPISYTCFCGKEAISQRSFQLEVRTAARPETVITPVRALLAKLNPAVTFREVHTLAQDVDDSLWAERTLAATGTAFSAVAALVACLGLYGLLSYSVTQRRKEIGIRAALGANRAELARVVAVRVLLLVAAGAVLGAALAFWTGRMLESVLWEIRPGDPRALVAACAIVLATAAAAAALPAWRAGRIDPAQALREN
jgi:predicted permease